MPLRVMETICPASTFRLLPLRVCVACTSAPSIILLPAKVPMVSTGAFNALASTPMAWVTLVLLPALSVRVATRL
ncbi:hypothetical protein D3C77_654750 [compost metagenome]